jgi:hypothetical protein
MRASIGLKRRPAHCRFPIRITFRGLDSVSDEERMQASGGSVFERGEVPSDAELLLGWFPKVFSGLIKVSVFLHLYIPWITMMHCFQKLPFPVQP